MTAGRRELHELIDELPDDQVPAVAEDLRRRARTQEPFAWVGMGPARSGPTDNARRVDELLEEGFGQD